MFSMEIIYKTKASRAAWLGGMFAKWGSPSPSEQIVLVYAGIIFQNPYIHWMAQKPFTHPLWILRLQRPEQIIFSCCIFLQFFLERCTLEVFFVVRFWFFLLTAWTLPNGVCSVFQIVFIEDGPCLFSVYRCAGFSFPLSQVNQIYWL